MLLLFFLSECWSSPCWLFTGVVLIKVLFQTPPFRKYQVFVVACQVQWERTLFFSSFCHPHLTFLVSPCLKTWAYHDDPGQAFGSSFSIWLWHWLPRAGCTGSWALPVRARGHGPAWKTTELCIAWGGQRSMKYILYSTFHPVLGSVGVCVCVWDLWWVVLELSTRTIQSSQFFAMALTTYIGWGGGWLHLFIQSNAQM